MEVARDARATRAAARAARRPREARAESARDARATSGGAGSAASTRGESARCASDRSGFGAVSAAPTQARARDARATGMSAGSAKGRLKSRAAAALIRKANETDSGLPARGRSAECAREAKLLEVSAHWALASRGGQEGGPALRASMFIKRVKCEGMLAGSVTRWPLWGKVKWLQYMRMRSPGAASSE